MSLGKCAVVRAGAFVVASIVLAMPCALRAEASPAAPVAVYPSAASVPEALLRITLVFATPQDDEVADAVVLRGGDGRIVPHPFADPPLWSADRRTLALVLDPSRQKLGLRAHRAYGFVLRAGERTTLALRGVALRSWRVAPGTCAPPIPSRWRVSPVTPGTFEPAVVRFDAPVDIGARDALAVAASDGSRVDGRARIVAGERAWTFAPARAWRRGDRIAIDPRLENGCGDEIGEPFEHRPGTGLGTDRTTTFLALPVRP